MSESRTLIGAVRLRWEASTAPALAPELARLADDAWRGAIEHAKSPLFDAPILTVAQLTDDSPRSIDVVGRFVPYRYFYAQREAAGADFGIRPIAVSGLSVLIDQGVAYAIIGRRSDDVTQFPGWLELVPSGGISQRFAGANHDVNYTGQLAAEFTEETGLPASAISSIVAFALVFDAPHRTYDIACRVDVQGAGIDRHAVRAAFARSGEYAAAPEFVPVAELRDFSARHAAELVPTSAALIDAWARRRSGAEI